MNKKIEFDCEGEHYILEYNRETVAIMEKQGFSINKLAEQPMVMLPLAFEGLFLKNHKKVKKTFIEECYDRFKNKEKLIEVIGEMLAETYSDLTDDKENEKGNLDWEIVG
jgi:hypothetical protein